MLATIVVGETSLNIMEMLIRLSPAALAESPSPRRVCMESCSYAMFFNGFPPVDAGGDRLVSMTYEEYIFDYFPELSFSLNGG